MAEENTEEKKKGGLLKIIIFAVGGLGLIGAGLGIGFLLFGGGPADPSEEIEEIIERKLKEEQLAAEAEAAEARQLGQGLDLVQVADAVALQQRSSGVSWWTSSLKELRGSPPPAQRSAAHLQL